MYAVPIPFFHSSFRQREDEDGMKVSKTGCSTLGNVACALRSIKLATHSSFTCVYGFSDSVQTRVVLNLCLFSNFVSLSVSLLSRLTLLTEAAETHVTHTTELSM